MASEMWATVMDVQTAPVGDFLTADATIGATTLVLSDVRPFDELGGQIVVNGEQYVYTSLDEDASTLTLFSGLLAAAATDDRVDISPPASVKRALVRLGEDEDEGVWANVPQALVNSLPDGMRTTDLAESVSVEERAPGELYVKDVAASSAAADVLTVGELQGGHLCVIKQTDESRASNTTATADAELKVYLTVGTWRVEFFPGVTGADAGDVKISWSFSGTTGLSSGRLALGPNTTNTDNTNATLRMTGFHALVTNVPYGTDDATGSGIREDIILDVQAEGTLTMLWAQNTSNATATTVQAMSRIYATRMSS